MSAIFSKIFQSSTKGKESASVKLPSEIQNIDQNADGVVDKDELQVYIDQNAQLWAMLSVNCNIPESQCREIARDTARTMAKLNTLGKFATFQDLTPLNAAREPTVEEFAAFHQRLKQEPQYQLEFFHQTVFCAYDHDHNGFIEGEEINDFIDLFYEANGCFAGDARLPPKDHLKSAVLETFDTNGDGKLEFHELRPLISGGASGFTKDLGPSAEWPETKPTQDETEKEIEDTKQPPPTETTKPKSKSKASSSSSSAITSNPQDGDHAASKTTTSKATATTTTTTSSSSSSAKKKALKKDKSERKLKKKEKSERKLRKEGSDPKVVKRTHSSSDSNSKLKGKVKSDSKMKRDGSDPKIKPRDNDATHTATTKRKGTTEKSSKHKSTSSDNKPHASSSSSTTPSSDTPKKSLKSHKKSSSSRNRSPSKTRSRSQSKTRSQSQTPRLRSQSRTRSKSRPSRRRASLKD